MSIESFPSQANPTPERAEQSAQQRIDAYRQRINDMSAAEREAHNAFVERGYELHGAGFADILLGLDSSPQPKYVSPEATELAPTNEILHHDATEVATEAENLVESVNFDTRGTHGVVETPRGRMEIETAHLGADVSMEVLLSADGIEAIGLQVGTDEEHHSVGIAHPRHNPEVTIDGEPARAEEVPMVASLIEHVQETEAEAREESERPEAEEANEEGTPEESPIAVEEVSSERHKVTEKAIPDHSAEKQKAVRFAFDFVRAYAANKYTQAYLRNAGIDIAGLSERFKNGQVEVNAQNIAQMRKLSQEAHFRGSAIWDTEPGDRSALQRAANEKRDELARILRSL